MHVGTMTNDVTVREPVIPVTMGTQTEDDKSPKPETHVEIAVHRALQSELDGLRKE